MASADAADAKQQTTCRLCYYVSDDTVPIFGEAGQSADLAGKIAKYLYLRVRRNDALSQVVCWMCQQHLVTFHQFHAKINGIQRARLKDGYEALAISDHDERDAVAEVASIMPEANSIIIGGDGDDDKSYITRPCRKRTAANADAEIAVKESDVRKTRSSKHRDSGTKSNSAVECDRKETDNKQKAQAMVKETAQEQAPTPAKIRRGRPPKNHKSAAVARVEEDDPEREVNEECSKGDGDERSHRSGEQKAVNRRVYTCQDCEKTFESPGGLCSHRKWVHGGRRQEQGVCHICAKSFATRAGLIEHMERHRPREETQVQCTECGKWLMNKRCLKTHKLLHSDVMLVCELCNYTTKKATLIKRHMVSAHTEAKPYACTLCDKAYKLKRPLKLHMLEAHGEKKAQFVCPFCGRTFNSSTNFYTHRKNQHPVELAALRAEEAAERRKRRIEAGVEEGGDDGDGIEHEYKVWVDEEELVEPHDKDVISLIGTDAEALLKAVKGHEKAAEVAGESDEYDDIMVELIEVDQTDETETS